MLTEVNQVYNSVKKATSRLGPPGKHGGVVITQLQSIVKVQKCGSSIARLSDISREARICIKSPSV